MPPSTEPVVCLHSVGLDRRSFGPLRQRFPHRFLTCPDLRGHGLSKSHDISLDGNVADVLEHLDRPVHLVGHSFGGVIAGLAAEQSPDRVLSLTLVATPPRGMPAFAERAEKADELGRSSVVSPTLERWGPLSPETEAYATECLADISLQAWSATWRALAGFVGFRLTVPVLLVAGSLDRSTPPAVMQTISDVATTSVLEIVEGAGHLLPMERPAALAALLENHWKASS